MIEVTPTLSIDPGEIREDFVRSSGPGGQKVNKTSTAVQLRFNVTRSSSLPEEVRQRLKKIAGQRITEEGDLIIQAQRYRSQARNREDALQRLMGWIRKAAETPKQRRATVPSRVSQAKRLAEKRRRSTTKRQRRPVDPSEE